MSVRRAPVPGQIIGYDRRGRPIRLQAGSSGAAVVQAVPDVSSGATTLTITLSDTTEGNCVVVCVGVWNDAGEAPTISSVKLGTSSLTQEGTTPAPGGLEAGGMSLWRLEDIAADQTSVVITIPSGTGNTISATAYEVSGMPTSGTLLDQSNNDYSDTSAWASGDVTTTQDAEIAFGIFLGWEGSGFSPTGPASPWVNTDIQNSSSEGGLVSTFFSGYQILSSTGTLEFSGTGGNTGYWNTASIWTLKAATSVTHDVSATQTLAPTQSATVAHSHFVTASQTIALTQSATPVHTTVHQVSASQTLTLTQSAAVTQTKLTASQTIALTQSATVVHKHVATATQTVALTQSATDVTTHKVTATQTLAPTQSASVTHISPEASAPYLAGSNHAASGGSTSLVITLSSDVAAGDSVLVGVLVSESGVTPTVSDSQNNGYTQILDDTTETAAQLYVFEADGVSAMTSEGDTPDTITITYSANTSVQGAIAVGDSNVFGSDKAVIAHGSSTSPSSGSSGTLSQEEEHAIAFIVDAAGGGSPTWASPWSSNVLANIEGGTTTRLSAAFQVVNATTALTGSGTITSAAWAAAIVTTEVNPPSITNTLSFGVENETYSQTLAATGGVSSYTYSITSGSLPTGLSLSDGVISGTPTESGDFTITITVTDSEGITGTSDQTITVLASGVSGAPVLHMAGQLLSADDQDGEGGAGTWAGDSNAETVSQASDAALTGDYSIMWTASAAGETSIHTGYYAVTPGKPYVASGFILPCGIRDTQIGIEWYESDGTLISQDLGADNPSASIAWQPVTYAGTAPSNAAKCKIVYLVQEANAGDVTHIDCTYFAQTGAQVLIDWINPSFANGSEAGQDFMDVTPWVRWDQGINMQRGRQDGISEIQAGSASFSLQNDTGLFTRYNTPTLISAIGGDQTLQRRVQINLADENGAFWTRWDGPVSEIDYTFDNTGNTSIALVNATDVLAELNRQDPLACWTKELVLSDGPAYHWTLDDLGNLGGAGVAAESSGNNGPAMRLINTDNSRVATVSWQDTGGGVETLADAALAGQNDGSEYWSPGNTSPNSQIRGLDSTTVGPYSSPLPSAFLTPKLAGGSNANYYVTNSGYQFQVALPTVIDPNATGSDYSFEIWFTLAADNDTDASGNYNNGIIANVADNLGPFTILSLGNSRTGLTLVLAVAYSGGNHLTFQTWIYDQPPAFSGNNFSSAAPPSDVAQISTELTGDTTRLPHHAVITIQGDPSSPTVLAYLDGALFGDEFTSASLATGSVFDTFCVGGAFGGKGAFWGNVQLASIYDELLSGQQIINHAQMGQYGMWEETTDDCIYQLSVFANIPSFWNNLSGGTLGLTMTEYQDITGSNALTNMQLYEDAEMGLLFVDASGRLNFHTRDWRMGHGAPDLYLPPDTFDASMGLETIDQFQVNEEAVSTQTYQTGAAYVNTDSQDKYGTYATNAIGSPLQLPLITWSRGYGQLGLESYYYWADPYLEDYCAWIANSKAEPWLVPGQLTFDILTLSKDETGIGISDLYALEIDSMIAPSGTQPASFPNANLSTEWFIEGVNETYSLGSRQLQFFTSPGEPQRAWKPGDATYGVLGATTRIGISGPDTNAPVADGKDVSHDAGGPYWAPTFTTSEALNDQTAFSTGSATEWNAYLGDLTTDDGTDYPGGPSAYSLVGTGTGGDSVSIEQSGTDGPIAVTGSEVISVGAWIFSPAGDTVTVGVDYLDSDSAYVSTATGGSTAIAAGSWAYVSYTNIEVPATGVSYAYARADSSTDDAVIVVQDLKIVPGMEAPADMNSPAQDGSGFVGAVDMRGLVNNLQLALNPPMCVVGCTSKTQTQGSGANSSPQIYWDNVYVDTAGGMGLVPGWPNWYVCTVPGFYDIDGCVVWAGVTGAAQAAQGFIVVAKNAAQWIAEDPSTNTPLNADQYVCPIGEQDFVNAHNQPVVNSPSTRLYLGVGDMVTIAAEQGTGSSLATSASLGGSKMSILFRGYATSDDRVQMNSSVTGGIVTNATTYTKHTKTYQNVATYSYNGKIDKYGRVNTNGNCYQGCGPKKIDVTGARTSLILMPWETIQSDLSDAVVKALTLTCSNINTYYTTAILMLGWSKRTSPGSTRELESGTDFENVFQQKFSQGQTITFSIPVSSFGSALQGSLGCFLIGAQSKKAIDDLDFDGAWMGGAKSWTLTVEYETS